jgi:hypothetical protein
LLAACAAPFGCGGSQLSGAYANVPYCADGNRARGCIGSKVCDVTPQGCQVCSCDGFDDE